MEETGTQNLPLVDEDWLPPPPRVDDGQWRKQAACIGQDHLFLSDSESGEYFKPVEAKAICSTCPVQPECLRYAQALKPEVGIWAGYTAQELLAQRRAIQRKARIAAGAKR